MGTTAAGEISPTYHGEILPSAPIWCCIIFPLSSTVVKKTAIFSLCSWVLRWLQMERITLWITLAWHILKMWNRNGSPWILWLQSFFWGRIFLCVGADIFSIHFNTHTASVNSRLKCTFFFWNSQIAKKKKKCGVMLQSFLHFTYTHGCLSFEFIKFAFFLI